MGVPHPEIAWFKNGALVEEGPGKGGGVDLKAPFLCQSIQPIIGFFSGKMIERAPLTFD